MSKQIVYIATIVVCILFQMGLAPAIAIAGATPTFLLLPVLLIALYSGPVAGAVAGFLLGMLCDFIGDAVIGCYALTFVLIAILVGLIANNLTSKTPLMMALTGFVGAFLSELIYAFVLILANAGSTGVISTLVTYALPCALYTAVICVVGLVTMCLVTADDGGRANILGSNSNKVFRGARKYK